MTLNSDQLQKDFPESSLEDILQAEAIFNDFNEVLDFVSEEGTNDVVLFLCDKCLV